MKKKISLRERVNKEKASAEKFDQGFKMEPMTVASVASPKKPTLSEEQNGRIKELFSAYKTEEVTPDKLNEDLQKTLEISSGIKSIVEQSALLIGERIKKAQAVMSNYRGGMFNKWLFLVFGNKVTPYNILNYYNLYNSIEDRSVRGVLEQLPKRAAYKLASRRGDLSVKIQVLNDCTDARMSGGKKALKTAVFEKMIDKSFPLDNSDNRVHGNKRKCIKEPKQEILSCVDKILQFQKKVESYYFSDREKAQIRELQLVFESWLVDL